MNKLLESPWLLRLATVAGVLTRIAPDVAGWLGVGLIGGSLAKIYDPLGTLWLGSVLLFVAWRHWRHEKQRPPS